MLTIRLDLFERTDVELEHVVVVMHGVDVEHVVRGEGSEWSRMLWKFD